MKKFYETLRINNRLYKYYMQNIEKIYFMIKIL